MAGPRSLTYITQPIARRAIGRKHADLGLLLAHWEDIVGVDMAQYAVPDRIAKGRRGAVQQGAKGQPAGAILHIRVTPGAASRLQHEIPRLVARLNSVLGAGAIETVRLTQGAVGNTGGKYGAANRRPAPLPAADTAELDAALARVTDPGLRATLSALGERVYRRTLADASGAGRQARKVMNRQNT